MECYIGPYQRPLLASTSLEFNRNVNRSSYAPPLPKKGRRLKKGFSRAELGLSLGGG